MISRRQIVDLVELASANFDKLYVGTACSVAHARMTHADVAAALPTASRYCLRRTPRPAGSVDRTPSVHRDTRRRACEHCHSFVAWSDVRSALADREPPLPREPTSVPFYRVDLADLPSQLHFDGSDHPPQWYSRRHIFTSRKDAEVRLERSLGDLNEQRWCERLLDVRRKHGTKSNSSSRSSSPDTRPSARGPGPGGPGPRSKPAVRSNPTSRARTAYGTDQRARSYSVPSPLARRPPIHRDLSNFVDRLYRPDDHIVVTEDPE